MPQKSKAIFLDRDGTVVHDHKGFVLKPRQLRILSGAREAIREFNRLGFLVIMITNQPVVSRGLITEKGMKQLHESLMRRIEKSGAKMSAAYFCPHHPDSKIKKYGIKCRCRKPESGMILDAIKDFNIDPKKSFMVGDALIDVVAGKRAGVKTIQVKTGPGHERLDKLYKNTKPDFITKDLISVARIIKTKAH